MSKVTFFCINLIVYCISIVVSEGADCAGVPGIEPYELTFESRYGSGSFDGYSAFTAPSDPPNYYLRASYSGGWSVDHYDYTWAPYLVVRRLQRGWVPYRSASLVVGGSSWFDAAGARYEEGVVNGIPLWTNDYGRGIHWSQEVIIPPAGPAYVLTRHFSESLSPLQRRVRAQVDEIEQDGYMLGVIGRHDYVSGNKLFAIGYNKSNPEIVITLSEPNTVARELAKRGDLPVGNDPSAWLNTRSGRSFSGQSSEYIARFSGLCPGAYRAEVTFHRHPFGEPEELEVITETRQLHVPSDSHGDYEVRGDIPAVTGQITRFARIVLFEERDCGGNGGALPGQWNYSLGSVRLSIGLGQVDALISAGRIYLETEILGEESARPSALRYVAPERGVTVVRTEEGALGQILAPEVFVDVVEQETGPGYRLDLYHAEAALIPAGAGPDFSGPYEKQPGSVPYASYELSYDASEDSLRIEQHLDGVSRVLGYRRDPDSGEWAMVEGDGLRVTRRREESLGNNRQRILTTVTGLVEGIPELVRKVEEIYEYYNRSGVTLRRLVERTEDPEGVAKTERRYYHTEGAAGAAAGKLFQVEHPNGSWFRYVYDPVSGELAMTIEGLGNHPPPDPVDSVDTFADLNRVTLYLKSEIEDLDGDDLPELLETEELWIAGTRVSREFVLRHSKRIRDKGWLLRRSDRIESADPNASWNDPANLVTQSCYYENGPWVGHLRWESGPDMTGESIRHVVTAAGGLVTHHYRGLLSETVLADNPFLEGIYQIRETDYRGRLVREAVYERTTEAQHLVSETFVAEADAFGRPTLLVFADGSFARYQYACCGLESETDRRGQRRDYRYDGLGRREMEIQYTDSAYPWVRRRVYDGANRVVKTNEGNSVDALVPVSGTGYNLAGEVIYRQSRWLDEEPGPGYRTNYTYGVEPDGSRVVTELRPDGGTVITRYFRDGRLAEIRGNAVLNERYHYAVESSGGFAREVDTVRLLDPATGTETGEYTRTFYDAMRRVVRVERPSAAPEGGVALTDTYYHDHGRKVRTVDPDGLVSFNSRDVLGKTVTEVLSSPGSLEINYSGNDRILRRTRSVSTRQDAGVTYLVERQVTEAWEEAGSDVPTVIRIEDVAILPPAQGGNPVERSWIESEGKIIRVVVVHDPLGGSSVRTISYPGGSAVRESFQADLLVERSLLNSSGETIATQSFAYNAGRRLVTIMGPRSGANSTFSYYADGQLRQMISPDPDPDSSAPGDQPAVSVFTYNLLPEGGLRQTVTRSGDRQLVNEIGPDGNTRFSYGFGQYPVRYEHDSAGRLRYLTTWSRFDFDEGVPLGEGAVSSWEYNDAGLLVSKGYPDGPGPQYTYTTAGRLKSRIWARGVGTHWSYGFEDPETAGPGAEAVRVDYSDGTPATTMAYDRMGRLTGIDDASGSREYDYEGQTLKGLRYTGGLWAGMALNYEQDAFGRPTGYTLTRENDTLSQIRYRYQPGSNRLGGIESGEGSGSFLWEYDYHPGTPALVSSVSLQPQQGGPRWRYLKDYDLAGRLQGSRVLAGEQLSMDSVYRYDESGLRSGVNLTDGSDWDYRYDDYGQLLSGERRDSEGALVPGYRFGYVYDAIGNRTYRNLPSGEELAAEYNEDNQLMEVESARLIALRGLAHPGAGVEARIDGHEAIPAQRSGEQFFAVINLNEFGPEAQLLEATVEGRLEGGGLHDTDRVAEEHLSVYLKENPESFAYDTDGNLTQDGDWLYQWDAENRLITMESSPQALAAGLSPEKREYVYDSGGRRVLRKDYRWSALSGDWEWESTLAFFYQGWSLIYEERLSRKGGEPESYHYVWGLDLAEQQDMELTAQPNAPHGMSSGVGALLGVHLPDGSIALPRYDGNGNITAYHDAHTETLLAAFDYGPFGEPLLTLGPRSSELTFRFSTRYTDPTGHIYYGYRYYHPLTTRWLNRDPIGEAGGLNLYGFVGNDPVNQWDVLGLKRALSILCEANRKCEQLKVALTFAQNARGAYQEDDGNWKSGAHGWRRIRNYQDLRSGFSASLFQNEETGAYQLAYRGTEFSSRADWYTNVREGVLGAPCVIERADFQHNFAVTVARDVINTYGDFSITGHSLGGGLGSLAGAATALQTMTFNSAGLNNITLRRHNLTKRNFDHIQAYYVSGEILHAVQRWGHPAKGKHIRLPAYDPKVNLWDKLTKSELAREVDRHSIERVIQSIEKEIDRYCN